MIMTKQRGNVLGGGSEWMLADHKEVPVLDGVSIPTLYKCRVINLPVMAVRFWLEAKFNC